jgi:hypothetical protein
MRAGERLARMLKRLILGAVALPLLGLTGLGCSKANSDSSLKDKPPAVKKKGGDGMVKDAPKNTGT